MCSCVQTRYTVVRLMCSCVQTRYTVVRLMCSCVQTSYTVVRLMCSCVQTRYTLSLVYGKLNYFPFAFIFQKLRSIIPSYETFSILNIKNTYLYLNKRKYPKKKTTLVLLIVRSVILVMILFPSNRTFRL